MRTNDNLPPGVTSNMLPGNRPEDALHEQLWDKHYCDPELFSKFLLNHLNVCGILVHDLATWEDINAFLDHTPDLRTTFDDWLDRYIADGVRDNLFG